MYYQIKIGPDLYTIAGQVVIPHMSTPDETAEAIRTMPFHPDPDEFLSWGRRENWFTEEDIETAEIINEP